MASPRPTKAVKLTGTDRPDVPGRTLRAGALSAVLDRGALRYVRLNGVEVLRAIAFLVRDENWGTFAPDIADLKVRQGAAGFEVNYAARCADARRALAYRARIVGKPDGALAFTVTAVPETDVLTNRAGFVVLHPLEGVAGRPVVVEHVDGRKVTSTFPAIVDPVQPFKDIRSLSHEALPGVWATCRMDGDTFEMEDHRNWTDASFKTYVRPLALPWPYVLPAGKSFDQAVTLGFAGRASGRRRAGGGARIAIGVGRAGSQAMPRIGVGVTAAEAQAALAAAETVRALGPQILVCTVDARARGLAPFGRYHRLAEATGAQVALEIVIEGKGDPGAELAPVAQAVKASGLKPGAVFVTPSAHLKAVLPGSQGPKAPGYEELYRAARRAFPRVPLGGGMYSFFTELNRNRPPAALIDFVTHTTCPIVHAADDVSVMETLQALPFVIRSTRAFMGNIPYRVGPSTIAARDNPYGAASAPNPDNSRVCLAAMDPRQRGLFGAAWALGYAAAFAAGGLDAVALAETTGPRGLIYRKTADAQPYFDAVGQGLFPAFHVVAGLAAAAGSKQVAATSSDPACVVALAHKARGGTVLWLANLTAGRQNVRVTGLTGSPICRVLDERSFIAATRDPRFFATGGRALARSGAVELGAYAVARVGPG